MRSETVSVINLQTFKSILKSVQKKQNVPFLLFKFKKKYGAGAWPLPKLHPFCVTLIRPHDEMKTDLELW